MKCFLMVLEKKYDKIYSCDLVCQSVSQSRNKDKHMRTPKQASKV